jgi:RNA-directed DNA polymerase
MLCARLASAAGATTGCSTSTSKASSTALHYAFDMWMTRTFPQIPFERYADDIICHCKSGAEREDSGAKSQIASRSALVLHPEKTKIVYCKDVNRRGDFPDISFDFLGFSFEFERSCRRNRTGGSQPRARGH